MGNYYWDFVTLKPEPPKWYWFYPENIPITLRCVAYSDREIKLAKLYAEEKKNDE